MILSTRRGALHLQGPFCVPIDTLWRPRFDKKARLLAQAPNFEAGEILLPREVPWLAAYVSELLAFPNGSHDDQGDSTLSSPELALIQDRIWHPSTSSRPTATMSLGRRSLPLPFYAGDA